MGLFQHSVLKNYLKFLPKEKLENAWQKFVNHFHNPIIQENIRGSKEEQYQEGFLNDLFVGVFGYVKSPNPSFNLTTELKNIKDAKKTDGALLRSSGNAFAVIELKGMDTTDLSKVETQAFGYKNNQPNCTYVIISNFEKLRFYIDNAIEFEEFNLFTLTRERFEVLYFCLSFETLLRDDKPKLAKEESINKEESITNALYKDYSNFRNDVFANIQQLNPQYDKLTLFKKTQKLLDRFLFIFFAEDKLLVPPNLIQTIIEEWRDLADTHRIEMPLYEKYKLYFGYLYVGDKNKKRDIFPYNGGLFQTDKLLDSLIIDDALLVRHTQKISLYDFDSDVSVNILGHIFEHSLNEFEEIEAEITGTEFEKTSTKRKKDGVFYTPKYITKYIIDNTVGNLCKDKKQELEITEDLLEKNYKVENGKPISNKKINQELKSKIENYKSWLLELTICDPACGSGAFLNETLEFLINEHHYIYELELKLIGNALIDNELENKILKNNIFGVDINEESVEIAKLSLWLRTAHQGRKLITLNDNIKCGNSLIDDKKVAGEKAFNWKKEFPAIFKNKDKKGGFDVVVGNPPYVPTEYISDEDKTYFTTKYVSAYGRINLYIIFYEQGINLLRKNGLLGFITPYTILKNKYYLECRRFILENTSLKQIIDFQGMAVFKDAAVDSVIIITKKFISSENNYIQIYDIQDFADNSFKKVKINQNEILLKKNDLSLIHNLFVTMINKLSINSLKVEEVINFKQGIITGDNKKFITQTVNELSEKILTGSDFNRYSIKKSNQYINYDIAQLHRSRTKDIFEVKEKILLRQTSSYPICTIDTEQHYTLDTIHNGIVIDDNFSIFYLLALLNSSLLRFLYENSINETGKIFAQVKIIYINPLPIKNTSKENQQPFIDLANKMISLNEEFEAKKNRFLRSLSTSFNLEKLSKKLDSFYEFNFKDLLNELEKKKITLSLFKQEEWQDYFEEYKKEILIIQNQIEDIDNQIDKLVFELYELTEEEIEIVKK